MFCCRRSNSLVNYIYDKALRVVYDDHSSSYAELIMVKNEPTKKNLLFIMRTSNFA